MMGEDGIGYMKVLKLYCICNVMYLLASENIGRSSRGETTVEPISKRASGLFESISTKMWSMPHAITYFGICCRNLTNALLKKISNWCLCRRSTQKERLCLRVCRNLDVLQMPLANCQLLFSIALYLPGISNGYKHENKQLEIWNPKVQYPPNSLSILD